MFKSAKISVLKLKSSRVLKGLKLSSNSCISVDSTGFAVFSEIFGSFVLKSISRFAKCVSVFSIPTKPSVLILKGPSRDFIVKIELLSCVR